MSEITKKQSTDSGMALVLISLIVYLVWKVDAALYCAVVFLVINMTVPTVFKPFAWLWFGLSTLIGTVMSKILLSIVFITIVTPIGLLRRLLGKDSLQLKNFKKSKDSVFLSRDHKYTENDIAKPF
jgi:hypothetical protein